jgi:hypothetical protein
VRVLLPESKSASFEHDDAAKMTERSTLRVIRSNDFVWRFCVRLEHLSIDDGRGGRAALAFAVPSIIAGSFSPSCLQLPTAGAILGTPELFTSQTIARSYRVKKNRVAGIRY